MLQSMHSRKYYELDKLAKATKREIFGSVQEYWKFLDSVAWTYKYPVEDQVLLYAQRPNTKAAASMMVWNQKVKRWINPGSKGIGLLRCHEDRGYDVAYVFAVEDTHAMESGNTFALWSMEPSSAAQVAEQICSAFQTGQAEQMEQAVEEAAKRLFSEETDAEARQFFVASVQRIVLCRCGMQCDATPYIPEHFDLESFERFLNRISESAQNILRCIESAVKTEQRREKNGNHLSRGKWSAAPERHSAGRSVGAGEIRTDAHEVAEGERQMGHIQAADGWEHKPILHARREDSPENGGRSGGETAGEESGSGKAGRPIRMGAPHELPDQSGRGDHTARVSVYDPGIPAESGSGAGAGRGTGNYEQINFLSQAEDTGNVSSAFSFSSEQIDQMLIAGGNEPDLRMMVALEYMKGKSTEEIAKRLPELYCGSNGFKLDGAEVSVWFNEQCIHIARGKTARFAPSRQVVSWQEAAERIGKLLESGEYATNVELVEAPGYERTKVAESLWYLFHDLSENGRELGCLASLQELGGGGFPDETKALADKLEDPEFRSVFMAEYQRFLETYRDDRSILRFHYHKLERLEQRLKELSLPLREYHTDMAMAPVVRQFITDDEINESLSGGSGFSGGKARIYAYWQSGHSAQDKANFLKNEYGTGGRSRALSGAPNSGEDHDAKGIRYTKAGCDKVQLSWAQVASRIDALINQGRYFDKDALEQYQQDTAAAAKALEEPQQDAVRDAEIEQMPVGCIEYLGTNGTPGEVVEYTDEEQFLKTIKEDTFYGVPLTVVLYRNEQGNTISQDFLNELDPPPKGFRVEDAPTLVEKLEQHSKKVNESGFEKEALVQSPKISPERPCIICEWSESSVFEDGKTYSVAEFDRLMKQADSEQVAVVEVAKDDPDSDRFMGYEKTKFTIVLPDGRRFTERQDIGDGDGGMLDFLRKYPIYKTILPVLEADAEQEKMTGTDWTGERAENRRYQVIVYHQEENGFDERLEYNTLEEAEKVAQGYLQGTEETDNFVYEGAAVFDLQEKRYCRVYGEYPDVAVQIQPLLPDLSTVPVVREGETITIGEGEVYHETDIAVSDEEYEKIIGNSAGNFHITDIHLGEGGPKARYQANITAIRLLKHLEETSGQADQEQQEVLSRYVGWGGVPEAFDPDNKSWNEEYKQLKELLTSEEYAAAKGSTLNAHYTSPAVIKAIYDAVGRMGFETGNILEPSCGVGNFFGMLPESMAGSRLYGVELDSITGRIAKKLYPKADITVAGFETTNRRDFFDLAVGNVPFGNYKVADKPYDKLGFSIHNYFFAKALDQVRPGGVVAFVTSRYTMDSKNMDARKYIAQRAELLGAIRLPNNAFKANAGTEVVSDIIFLQKRDHPIDIVPDWVHLNTSPDGFTMNSYFVEHPEMVLGELTTESTQYGKEDLTVRPHDGVELAILLNQAITNLHGSYHEKEVTKEDPQAEKLVPADPTVKDYSYTIRNEKIYYRENNLMRLCNYEKTGAGDLSMTERRIRGLITLRDALRTLIDIQVEGCSDQELGEQQKKLDDEYEEFTKSYGLVNSDANRRAFSADIDYPLIATLEEVEGRGSSMQLKGKSPIFTQRTIRQSEVVDHCDTAAEALHVSMGERGRVDLEYMEQLTGDSAAELQQKLKGIIFLEPVSRQWQTANNYLSGDIREKLAMAKQAEQQEPSLFAENVAALEQAMPEPIAAADISVRLGATWIAPEYIQQFAYETFGTLPWMQRQIQVRFSENTGNWFIENKSKVMTSDTKATVTYGTKRMNAYEILEQSLNMRAAKVVDHVYENGDSKTIPNPQQTMLAQQKQELIERTFKNWIFADPQRRESLVQLYNERFNTVRPCQYDGSHLQFHGMNPLIELKPHQKNAVAHVLYGKNTLLFHCVGAGKTYEMIASAMEAKRVGLLTKPMFVVPNHLTADFGSEFRRLYPQANVLVTRKEDFEKQNRRRFLAKIAMGEWDGVVIGHSQFSMLPVSNELQVEFIQKQLDELENGLNALRREKNEDRYSIKQMERSKKALQSRLEKLIAGQQKDELLKFEQLGIDKLYVDEADEFKNLAFASKLEGMGSVDSQKAMDLYLKCQYMDQKTNGKGVVFATGTPIANSIAEMFTMQRYLQGELLEKKGLTLFDSWASTFAESVSEMELKPEGTGYRMKTRLARFYNVPELMNMFSECADIVTADMVNLPRPEADYENVVIKPSVWQKQMVEDLANRAEAVRARKVEPTEDNMLRITNDGRALALDQRLINPSLPYEPEGKIAVCAANIAKIWEQTKPEKGTQIVFCDLATPGGGKESFSAYDELKRVLVEKEIPEDEIAFIHSANTDAKKQQLYEKVRAGTIRILIGSTAKMGAGTNVQKRLAALHHLDVPWRPRDIEQREGRIIRQGNQNSQVKIFRYVTEGTFDSYSWQIIEKKQRFISQVVTNRSSARSCEDLEGAALSYAEVKALAAGNPEIKERMDLEISVTKLRALKREYQTERYRLEDALQRSLPAQESAEQERLEKMQRDVECLSQDQGAEFAMVIQGKMLKSRADAAKALTEALKQCTPGEYKTMGIFQGFTLSAKADPWNAGMYQLKAEANCTYHFASGDSVAGIVTRLENQVRRIPELIENSKNELIRIKKEMQNTREELAKPWPMEEELEYKENRLTELNTRLSHSQGGKQEQTGEYEFTM